MIKTLRERKGLTQQDLAITLGVSQQSVDKWERGLTLPKSKRLEVVAKVLDVNLEQLLGGKLLVDVPPIVDVAEPQSIYLAGNARNVQPNIKELYRQIPFASIKAQAGIPESHEGCDMEWLRGETYPVYIRNHIANKKELTVEIDGDSMTPEIKDGAVVLAEAVSKNDIKYESGGIYAVLFGPGRFAIKRIKVNTINSEGVLRLWSDNEIYGYIDIPANEIHCMWKVVAKVWEPMK